MRAAKKTSKKMTKREWDKLIERKLYDAQFELVEKKFGKKAAQEANYGWGATEYLGHLGVATKVYVNPVQVLSSTADYPSLKVSHEWQDY
jgi:hypothetical protein